MYYPYIRGRQYELLALKELVSQNRLSANITPIIEPVKFSPTLIGTLEEFTKAKHQLMFIENPQVGSFREEYEQCITENNYTRYQKTRNARTDSDEKIIQKIYLFTDSLPDELNGKDFTSLTLINTNPAYLAKFAEIYSTSKAELVFRPDEGHIRRISDRHSKKKVILGDYFVKQERNSDYSKITDELFSEDHLYFKDENYVGFSDYSVIGSSYFEGGFAPFAVAIHIVYFDIDKRLKIKHFVSSSNDDIQNPAGKFHEALKELKQWTETDLGKKNITPSIQQFLEYYDNGAYPGLGTAKKLSLMHHLELMGQYLDQ